MNSTFVKKRRTGNSTYSEEVPLGSVDDMAKQKSTVKHKEASAKTILKPRPTSDTTYSIHRETTAEPSPSVPSLVAREYEKCALEELVRVKEEIKEWNKLLADNKQQTKKSELMSKALEETGDPRRALHGPRRSRYVPPPKWSFTCKEILDQVDFHVKRALLTAEGLSKQKTATVAVAPSSSELHADDSEEAWLPDPARANQSHIVLQTLHSGADLTMFEKSTRHMIADVVANAKDSRKRRSLLPAGPDR